MTEAISILRLRLLEIWRWPRAEHYLFCMLLLFSLTIAEPVSAADKGIDVTALDSVVSIAGGWKFRTGDDPSWSQPEVDDSEWTVLQVPQDWGLQGFKGYTGFAWYRLTLDLCAAKCSNDVLTADVLNRLAVTLGKVQSAYEFYAGGAFVGSVGSVPPNAEIRYDEFATYRIPRSAIDEQGKLVLAMRVWRSDIAGRVWEAGPHSGPFLLGPSDELTRQFFYSQLLALVLAAVYVVLGCYHCYLYTRHREFKEMAWFGLFAIAVSLYSFMTSQWRHILPVDFAILKKIEYAVVFMIMPIAFEFAARLMAVQISRHLRWYQFSFVAFAVIVMIVPGLAINFRLLPIFQVWVLPAIFGLLLLVVRQAYLGNTDARKVLVGSLILAAMALVDIAGDLRFVHAPAMLPIGFAIFVLSMPLPLGDRITRLVKKLQARTIELAELQKNLEQSVDQRTEELKKANQQLERVAHIDLLTQVANRRAFLDHAENEIAWARRSARAFALIVADIDHFKMFNDEFGHACGDFVLCEVAATLVKNVRSTDMFARWGGEEFVFILRETDAVGAVDLAEKCRQLIEQQRYAYGGMELGVTMTFGVSEYQAWMTIEECMEEADDALYHGKAAGRNTVACSKPGSQQSRAGSVIVGTETA